MGIYSIEKQKEKVKDELVTFVGELPQFRMLEDYLPKQKGKVIELKGHQQFAIDNLQKMRESGESIALLYHATGTGKQSLRSAMPGILVKEPFSWLILANL